MGRTYNWPQGHHKPPDYIRRPIKVLWNGHAMLVHLPQASGDPHYPHCGRSKRPYLEVNPFYLDWNRIKLCKHCIEYEWKKMTRNATVS